ncbi:PREDICTED: transcriptional activator FHA1 [Nicotiana attenuata]|uniref:Transcriptional activator fha1 n=1 Tax=Nicotiana attenuata TaxID=49451 RepID=A0A314KIB6_NICAT|nr:PREDICTED: transcriptional activator FHA1 [Nicotiana attenuata]OIT28920.1 transcriptional activator fha1 [Nicotiana attenuata]
MGSSSGSDVEAGFAKLQGEDFEYYMQTYSIILGRNSKKSTVDVDLSSLGGGMNISRHHARIFYDFQRRRFNLEVLGKNGCFVEGVLHLPGNPPIKLDSQDLLQIGDKEFYFLLPVRSILGGGPPIGHKQHVNVNVNYPVAARYGGVGKKGGLFRGREREYYDEEEYDDDDDGDDDDGTGGKKMRRGDGAEGGGGYGYGSCGSSGKASISGQLDKKTDGRLRVDRDADNQQLMQLEEKDVVSSVANVLSDLCGPGEWMPMEKLHAELVEHYGNTWHHSRVRRYLTSEDYPSPEAKTKPWYGLLMLLRKYPEHFVINTRSKGRVTLEFVSLVSLIS